MKSLKFLLVISSLSLAFGFNIANASNIADDYQDESYEDSYSNIEYVTASNIEQLDYNTDSMIPKVPRVSELYLDENNILGRYGPLGSEGPLGRDGPIQKLKLFNPSEYPYFTDYFKSSYNLLSNRNNNYLKFLDAHTDNDNHHERKFFQLNDFAYIRTLGLLGLLGTTGPFGHVGVLGPLGPVGVHGYSRDKQGNYIDKDGNIVTQVEITSNNKSKKVFDLYEFYKTEYAASKKDLDTSFVTLGSLKDNYSDDYIVNNDEKQIVTILVVPEQLFNYFDIQLYSSNGDLITESNSRQYINFIQFLAPKDTSYTVKVTSPDKSDKYALYVTGSTKYLNKYNIDGDHIIQK